MNQKCTLFVNAIIETGKNKTCEHDSLLVVDGKIIELGTSDNLRKIAPENSEIIDCQQKNLLPGFIDAHNHVTLLGASLRAEQFHYPAVSCIDNVLDVVAKAAKGKPQGEWIRGWGLDYGKFPNATPPTRFQLDEFSPDHPVAIVHYTGHYVLVNSKALELAGIDDTIADPKGGRFVRDEKGRLTGLAQDAAQQMVIPTSVNVKHHGPDIGYDTSDEELVADIACASDALLAVGVTSVVDPQVTTREMRGLIRAQHENQLGVRTICMYLSNHLEALIETGIHEMYGNDFLEIGPVKYYCDGAIVGGTAAFNKPLNNREDGYTGSTYWEDDNDLYESLRRTHSMGYQFGIHTQGDRAHDISIGAIERIVAEMPREDHRHRFEHSGYPVSEQIKRMAKCGIIPITQPGQLREAGQNLIDNYGEDRAQRIYPLREFLDNGIEAVISSDAFVQSYNPLSTILGAIERVSDQGHDMGSEQRISLKEAIMCHTHFAAKSYFWEDKVGSLEKGKYADIVLLDRDITNIPAKELLEVNVELTMVNGDIVYRYKN